MAKRNTPITLDGKTIRAMDVIHILFVVVAAVGLYFTIVNKQTNLADKQNHLDGQVDRLQTKTDDIIQRLARIEGALGVKPQAKISSPSSEAKSISPTPAPQQVTFNNTPQSGGSATTQSTPLITPEQNNINKATDIITNKVDKILSNL